MSKKNEHKCCQPMPGSFTFSKRTCGKPGKVEVDGKWYCGIHDPIKRALKREKRNAEWNARWEVDNANDAIDRARAELALHALKHRDSLPPLFDELLARYDAAVVDLAAAEEAYCKVDQ